MHETKFVNEIIVCLKKELAGNTSAKSVAVNVSLSPLSHVTPEGLRKTFELLAEAEGLCKVELEIKLLGVKVICNDCGNIFEVFKPAFNCPKCQSADINVETNREFMVNSICVIS
jgi:hydrogenase nickel incorporation protein HypA/HybF